MFHRGAGYNIADKNRASATPERQKADSWFLGGWREGWGDESGGGCLSIEDLCGRIDENIL